MQVDMSSTTDALAVTLELPGSTPALGVSIVVPVTQVKAMATALAQQTVGALDAYVPTVQNVMQLAVALAQDVNKLPSLKGSERLEIVLEALREILATPAVAGKISGDNKAHIAHTVDTVIPELIALTVSASRGGIALRKPSLAARLCAVFCCAISAVLSGENVNRFLQQATVQK